MDFVNSLQVLNRIRINKDNIYHLFKPPKSLSGISSEKDESEMTVEEKKELQKKRWTKY